MKPFQSIDFTVCAIACASFKEDVEDLQSWIPMLCRAVLFTPDWSSALHRLLLSLARSSASLASVAVWSLWERFGKGRSVVLFHVKQKNSSRSPALSAHAGFISELIVRSMEAKDRDELASSMLFVEKMMKDEVPSAAVDKLLLPFAPCSASGGEGKSLLFFSKKRNTNGNEK